jgi:hypothetical protein
VVIGSVVVGAVLLGAGLVGRAEPLGARGPAGDAPAVPAEVTFARDIAPNLQRS